jgi:hypothetical protein
LRSDELDIPENDDLKRDSTVNEVRQWAKHAKTTPSSSVFQFLLELEKLPPIEMSFTSSHIRLLHTSITSSEVGGNETMVPPQENERSTEDGGCFKPETLEIKNSKIQKSPQKGIKLSLKGILKKHNLFGRGLSKRTVRFRQNVTCRTFEASEIVRPTMKPQARNGRNLRSQTDDHPWMPSGSHRPNDSTNARASLRERISKARVARRVKRIPRKHVLSILKMKFKPCHLKHGIDVPGACRCAHARDKGNEYSDKWTKEETEEVGHLTGLDAFIKGLTLDDLPEGTLKRTVLRTLWVYDAKPQPRARLVADGSQEDASDDETFSPVLKLENVKVVLAVIAQEQMELKMIDVKKAFFKGRLHKPCYIWAPDGRAAFPGEIWSVQLPI